MDHRSGIAHKILQICSSVGQTIADRNWQIPWAKINITDSKIDTTGKDSRIFLTLTVLCDQTMNNQTCQTETNSLAGTMYSIYIIINFIKVLSCNM